MTTRDDDGLVSDASRLSLVVEVDGAAIRVIGRDALMRNKRAAGRPQDKADIRALEKLSTPRKKTSTPKRKPR